MGKLITYSSLEKSIIQSGFDEVNSVLMGTDTDAKERLLFCLDYYMDPYYGQTISYVSELIRLLEMVIVSDNSLSVKEDALQLLLDYTWPPYHILQSSLDKIGENLLPDVMYILNREE